MAVRSPPLTRSNTFMGRYIRYSNMGFSRQITFPIQILAEFGQAQPEPPDAAARRALWPVAGPSTGGDAAAAARPLPLLPPLPQPALDVDEAVQQQPAEHEVELEPRRPRSASAALPTLAVVVYVDSGWAPSSRTCRARPFCMCTHCMRTHKSRHAAQ